MLEDIESIKQRLPFLRENKNGTDSLAVILFWKMILHAPKVAENQIRVATP